MSNLVKFQYGNTQHIINLDMVERISYFDGYLYIQFNRGTKSFDAEGDEKRKKQLKDAYEEIVKKI